jgi:hypothetical protein
VGFLEEGFQAEASVLTSKIYLIWDLEDSAEDLAEEAKDIQAEGKDSKEVREHTLSHSVEVDKAGKALDSKCE